MFKFDKSMIGRKVVYISAEKHEDMPECYPPVGTIGTIVWIKNEREWAVQWPENSGVGKFGIDDMKYTWFCNEDEIELVEDSKTEVPHYTDDEIFRMLMPKLNKINTPINFELIYDNRKYEANTSVVKAVALAYRSGYGRGQKGRSFIIGEKAKGDAQCK